MQVTDSLINTHDEDMPTALPSLIDAAVAVFDADRDTSRRYLLRASALLRAERGPLPGRTSARRSESRGGLLAWQLNRVVDYIETHLADKIAAVNLASVINVSVGQLFRAFKISVGVAPFYYVTRRRVELACRMMRTTREPLSQIAVACGLCDQAHLCKVFRRMTGMSPSAWRRAIPGYAHIKVNSGDGLSDPAARTHAEEIGSQPSTNTWLSFNCRSPSAGST
jgi:AraC family transcriptional regulator